MPNDDKPKKNAVCKKVYVQPDGTETRSAHPSATVLEFRFCDGPEGAVKTVRSIKLGENPENIELQLDWFGRSELYGNSYAGAKGVAVDALEMFDTKSEILKGGEWSERKEGVGPRPSMVLDATVAWLVTVKGEKVDDARKARIKEKLTSTEGRKGALANEGINAEYEAIREKAQAAKTKAARAAAKGADTDTSAYK